MGRNHCRAYAHDRRVSRILVHEPFAESRKALEALGMEKIEFVDTLKKAAQMGAVAASIVTPTEHHFDVAQTLIESNLHILVEKPLTETVDQGKKLARLASAKKRCLLVGHIERFNPAVRTLKKHMALLGTPVYASAHRFGIPTPRKLSDTFLDQAVHDMDVIAYLSGKRPQAITAVEMKIVDKHSNDLCSAIVQYDGFYATVEANRVTPIKTRELVFLGTKGSAKLDYISQDLVITQAESVQNKFSTFDEILLRVGRGTEVKPYFQKDEPLRLELEHFISCVEGKETPLVTAEDGIVAVAAAAAGMKSAETGKTERIEL